MTDQKAYTHALTIQLEGIPQGYYPVGTEDELRALYDGNQEAVRRSSPLRFYELKTIPDCASPKVLDDFLLSQLKSFAQRDEDVTTSLEKFVGDARKNIADPFKAAIASAESLLKKATNESRPLNVMDFLPTLLAGQDVLTEVRKIAVSAVSEFESAMTDVKTEELLCNKRGVFVSGAWLENPDNATLRTTVTIKPIGPVKALVPKA